MAVGLQTGPIFFRIGDAGFLHCFFSTITYNLENSQWGSKFPYLMNDLYHKGLSAENIDKAKMEIETIQMVFKTFPPDKVVWDIDDLSQRPPWDGNIAARITDLSNYFFTSDGKDIFEVFKKALNTAKEINKDIKIRSF